MTTVAALTLVLTSYALGCFATGYYLVRLRAGTGLRTSFGATRDLSAWEFVLSFLVDVCKGAAPILAAHILHLPSLWMMVCAIAVVAGHIWPFQLDFNGGKGVGPMIGALLAFDHNVVVLLLLTIAILHLTNKQLMLSVLSGIALTPAFGAILGHSALEVAGLTILTLLVLSAHREQIKEILTEYGYLKPSTEK